MPACLMGEGRKLEIREEGKIEPAERSLVKMKVDIRNSVIKTHCNEVPSIINRLNNSKQLWEPDNDIQVQYLTTKLLLY